MSMGNFIGVARVGVFEMATNQHPRTSRTMADEPTARVGIAHLTVVPTNFEPTDEDE